MISIMDERKPTEIGEEILYGKKGHHGVVKPGPCSPKGCPSPSEIVCIRTKKIYQECKQVEPIERVQVYGLDIPPGACDVECIKVTPGVISVNEFVYGSLECPLPRSDEELKNEFERGKKKKLSTCECIAGEGTVTLGEIKNFPIRIVVEFFDRNGLSLGCQKGWSKICVPERTVLLSRAGESLLKSEIDIFLSCLMCVIEEYDSQVKPSTGEQLIICPKFVSCCINKVIVFKLLAEVQLMVPSYGFCPEPCRCDEEEQDECPEAQVIWPPYPDSEGGTGGCKGCR